MKTHVAVTLLGIFAFANAYSVAPPPRKLQTLRNFGAGAPGASSGSGAGAPGAPSAPHGLEGTSYEEEPLEERPVVYKAPTRIVERQPIRIAHNKYEEEPVHAGGRGGYGGASLRDDSLEQEYNRNAQYSFASAVDDGIMDQSHIRQETRDGLKVTGTYAYSDGFFKRTVNYEADENGYRVVGELVEPISENGPQIDLVNGRAEVHTQIGGVNTQYSVHADELDANQKRFDAAALLKKEKELF